VALAHGLLLLALLELLPFLLWLLLFALLLRCFSHCACGRSLGVIDRCHGC